MDDLFMSDAEGRSSNPDKHPMVVERVSASCVRLVQDAYAPYGCGLGDNRSTVRDAPHR